MNASDIVKAKQNKTLYKAYYRPTVFQSSLFSTLYTISSSSGESNNWSSITTSYTSCITQVNDYVCNPTFISYQFAKDVNDGSYECGLKSRSKLEWKPQEELRYLYSTIYSISTISTTVCECIYRSSMVVSSIDITSTTIKIAPQPLICPLVNLYQGTSYLNRCNTCNSYLANDGYCCNQCM